MADLVHLTPESTARRIARAGIAARSRDRSGRQGVYCAVILPSFSLTYQWMRELRRWKPGVMVSVHVRLPDDEPVAVGHYGRAAEHVTASEAIGIVRSLADPRGYEVFVPRAIAPSEIRRIRPVPQGIGWRHQPDAHGRRPCPCPFCLQRGTPGTGKLRRRLEAD